MAHPAHKSHNHDSKLAELFFATELDQAFQLATHCNARLLKLHQAMANDDTPSESLRQACQEAVNKLIRENGGNTPISVQYQNALGVREALRGHLQPAIDKYTEIREHAKEMRRTLDALISKAWSNIDGLDDTAPKEFLKSEWLDVFSEARLVLDNLYRISAWRLEQLTINTSLSALDAHLNSRHQELARQGLGNHHLCALPIRITLPTCQGVNALEIPQAPNIKAVQRL